jgi:hypothetical protein
MSSLFDHLAALQKRAIAKLDETKIELEALLAEMEATRKEFETLITELQRKLTGGPTQ